MQDSSLHADTPLPLLVVDRFRVMVVFVMMVLVPVFMMLMLMMLMLVVMLMPRLMVVLMPVIVFIAFIREQPVRMRVSPMQNFIHDNIDN